MVVSSASADAVSTCRQSSTEASLSSAGAVGASNFLEELTVTGTRTEKLLLESPVSMTVIGDGQLRRATATGLAELMRDVPGLQVADAGQAGVQRIRLRGEESRRVAMLINGQEVTDHREVGVPLTLHPALLRRVEVVRGAGSVLYGSKAIGGIVNFITKKGGTQALQGELSTSYASATGGESYFASLYGGAEGWQYRLAGARNRAGNRRSPEGEIENTEYESDSQFLFLGKKLTDHNFEIVYDNYDSASEVFVEEEVRTSFPLLDFRVATPQRDREKIGVFYEGTNLPGALQKVSVNAYYQLSDRQFDTFPTTLLPGPIPTLSERSIFLTSELETQGAVVQLDWRLGRDHYLVSGFQYAQDTVDQDRHEATIINGGTPALLDSNDRAHINTDAVFVQDEWQLTDHVAVTLGARHYRVDANLDATDRPELAGADHGDSHTIFGVSMVYSGIAGAALRANYAQGYVYPSLLQLATGAFAGSRFANPNAGLEPETSENYELGVRVDKAGWLADAALFYSAAQDYIDHVFCSTEDICPVQTSSRSLPKVYKNIGRSKSWGLEAYLSYKTTDLSLQPYLNITWLGRKNEFEAFEEGVRTKLETSDAGTPAVSARLGVLYESRFKTLNAGWWFDAFVRAESHADEEQPASSGRIVVTENPGWSTYNFATGIEFGNEQQFRLVLEADNLSNKTYSTANENLLAAQRSLTIKLSLALH